MEFGIDRQIVEMNRRLKSISQELQKFNQSQHNEDLNSSESEVGEDIDGTSIVEHVTSKHSP